MARIHQLKINHFRGIEQFEQCFGDTNLIVLIGRGDSGKSTILKAISLVLSPAWNNTFADTDFYNLDTTKPIEIEVSLRCVPDKLLSDAKYGLYKRLLVNGKIIDEISKSGEEPFAQEEDILTIKLVVDDTLQPKWYVVNDREQDNIEISHRDRALLDMFMIADYADNHFSYNKFSPLYTLLKKELDTPEAIEKRLVDVVRQAYRSIASNIRFPEFGKVASEIKQQAMYLGIGFDDLKTSLEYKGNAYTESNITLHDGQNRPLGMYGKGSKRLLSIAIQLALAKAGGIVLIDEIEQGLEPDRIVRVIRDMKGRVDGQIIVTTHSSYVLVEADYSQVYLFHQGAASLVAFTEEEQSTLRTQPHAFFATRIICCEGKTEEGILRAFDTQLRSEGGFTVKGIAICNGGGGDKFYKQAISLRKLGYDVTVFADADVEKLKHIQTKAQEQGVRLILCEEGLSIEEQLSQDLSWKDVCRLVELAISLNSNLNILKSLDLKNINELKELDEIRQTEFRLNIGKQAKQQNWFKDIPKGEALGEIWFSSRETLKGQSLSNICAIINGTTT
jgi:hypothetical protein